MRSGRGSGRSGWTTRGESPRLGCLLSAGLLGGVWFVLIAVAPVCRREWRVRCDVWSHDGAVLLSIPVLGLAVLVALGISIWSLVSGGHPVSPGRWAACSRR